MREKQHMEMPPVRWWFFGRVCDARRTIGVGKAIVNVGLGRYLN
jgi:hypothetical protein